MMIFLAAYYICQLCTHNVPVASPILTQEINLNTWSSYFCELRRMRPEAGVQPRILVIVPTLLKAMVIMKQSQRILTPESQLQNPNSRIPNPECHLPDAISRIPSPETQLPNSNYQIMNPKSRSPNCESQVTNPKSQTVVGCLECLQKLKFPIWSRLEKWKHENKIKMWWWWRLWARQ